MSPATVFVCLFAVVVVALVVSWLVSLATKDRVKSWINS